MSSLDKAGKKLVCVSTSLSNLSYIFSHCYFLSQLTTSNIIQVTLNHCESNNMFINIYLGCRLPCVLATCYANISRVIGYGVWDFAVNDFWDS